MRMNREYDHALRVCAVCGSVAHETELICDMCQDCREKCALCQNWYQIAQFQRTADRVLLLCDTCVDIYNTVQEEIMSIKSVEITGKPPYHSEFMSAAIEYDRARNAGDRSAMWAAQKQITAEIEKMQESKAAAVRKYGAPDLGGTQTRQTMINLKQINYLVSELAAVTGENRDFIAARTRKRAESDVIDI